MEADNFDIFMRDRVDDQIAYFDTNALKNQKKYKLLKKTSIFCNVFTTFTIGLAFAIPSLQIYFGIISLFLSTAVLFTYQWEEFNSYGAKWEKFRLVAEQLKSEKSLFLTKCGHYNNLSDEVMKKTFVEIIEESIRRTDQSYFTLMVEPGKRIEKRLSDNN